ncbi:condensation domain-containing protein [Muriicola sp. Z0-33]|uniref:condensation domain-containing protein n=1 Tax=Muriicola sp. Z0-33 TaxID=2816957 RepID=UPI00223780E3|nr:condensation domain-containing protein [Muriicola sp. Z0-33]MCW5515228.1 hypothetical protein [Muriicola sp. Z0-33]
MNTAKKSKIEAILPLSEMQEGILIHHLHSQWDEGFLHVEFGINGKLNREALIEAWELVIARHEILRTTIHWENIEKPLQVIHSDIAAKWQFDDWNNIDVTAQREKIKLQKKQNRIDGLDFQKNPSNNFHLIALEENKHYFLWPCHHLLLDGWSSSNIIKDVLAFYDAICKNEVIDLGPLPSLKSYYNWIKKKNPQEASQFWEGYFEGFQKVHLFNKSGASDNDPSNKSVEKIRLTAETSQELNRLSQKSKISLNTLIQGVWTLLLSVYFNHDDIIFGSAISGRSNDFPNMEMLCGVFTNILPIRGKVVRELTLDQWLTKYQSKQLSALKYGHVNQNEISDLLKDITSGNLFDSILIFENYPSKKAKSGDIELQGYRSGVTSNYPLSLMVLPHSEIVFTFIFQNDQINSQTKNWLVGNLQKLVDTILVQQNSTVQEIINSIAPPKFAVDNTSGPIQTKAKPTFVAPENDLEVQLVAIWEDILGHNEIGVNDNYFDLGGKSLMALKMIARINEQFDIKLPVTALLLHPTIKGLAQEIHHQKTPEGKKPWEFLIPLKPEGKKSPVFCIHAGEGHVLFYKKMSTLLDEDRPVYLVQPKGIHGDGPMHNSIEQMSKDYISEILEVPDVESYNLVFYCYSAIVVEMAKQFRKLDKKFNLIIIDSWGRPKTLEKKPGYYQRLGKYLKTLSRSPVLTIRSSIISRYRQSLEPLYLKWSNNKLQMQLRHIRHHLSAIYYKYQWEKINAPCTLILADKEHPELKKAKVASWEFWAEAELKVRYAPGNHFSIFEEPNVKHLAEIIEEECV